MLVDPAEIFIEFWRRNFLDYILKTNSFQFSILKITKKRRSTDLWYAGNLENVAAYHFIYWDALDGVS